MREEVESEDEELSKNKEERDGQNRNRFEEETGHVQEIGRAHV